MKNFYDDYEKFCKRVGLIESLEELEKIGAPVPAHENGMYETYREQTIPLTEFLKANQQYHLATWVDEGDEDGELCKIWLEQNPEMTEEDWIELDDDFIEKFREDNYVSVFVVDNCCRWVNRIGYYLCNGDKDETIHLVEINRG